MSSKTSIDTAKDRYQILLESTPLVPWEADARTWLFNYVGPQAADLLGYPVEDWYGDTFWVDHVHPDDRDAAVSTCERLSRAGTDYEFEYRMIRADGTTVWISDIVSVEMENGEPTVLRGFLIDVTDRKEAEAALARSESRFTELADSLPALVAYVDTEQQYQFAGQPCIPYPVRAPGRAAPQRTSGQRDQCEGSTDGCAVHGHDFHGANTPDQCDEPHASHQGVYHHRHPGRGNMDIHDAITLTLQIIRWRLKQTKVQSPDGQYRKCSPKPGYEFPGKIVKPWR